MGHRQYLARRKEAIYFPGHGPAITDAPRFVNYYIRTKGARSFDFASPVEGRNRHPDHRARGFQSHRCA